MQKKYGGKTFPICMTHTGRELAPVADLQGVVRSLISWKTKEIFTQNDKNTQPILMMT